MTRNRSASPSTRKILMCLSSASEGLHGYALMQTTGLASGTLYPILKRLTERGWLEREWETGPEGGGAPRRLYHLTTEGRRQTVNILRKSERATPDVTRTVT